MKKICHKKENMGKYVLGLITLVLLLLTVLSVFVKSNVIGDTEIEYTMKKTAGYIKGDRLVEHVFTPDSDIAGLKFLLANYGERVEKGIITVTVVDYDTNEILAETEIEARKIQDNQFGYADTGVLRVKDRKLLIQIQGRRFIPGKYVTIWMGENSLNEDGVTYIDGNKMENTLIFTTLRCEKGNPYTWELLLGTTFSFFLFVMQWKRNDTSSVKKEKKTKKKVKEKVKESSKGDGQNEEK